MLIMKKKKRIDAFGMCKGAGSLEHDSDRDIQ